MLASTVQQEEVQMATLPSQLSMAPPSQPSNLPISVKKLAESPGLKSIPSNYAHCDINSSSGIANSITSASSEAHQVSIPVIDLSLLSSTIPDHRLKAIRDLGQACQNWGCFMVVNHGIPERLIKAIIDATDEFFNLEEEEKMGYQTKHVLDPIRYGTSCNASKEQIFFWRDYLKFHVHPHFHSPRNPKLPSDLLLEYVKRSRQVASKLLGGISLSLGLEEDYIHDNLDLDSGLQIFIANYYPPCPQPELALGLPPHSDHGLLTLLLDNGVGGLQVEHQGEWLNVHPLPHTLLVNTADHLEIFSNGKYKSVLHRAVVNSKQKRISIAMTNGPSLDTNVGPCLRHKGGEEDESCETTSAAAYSPMAYREYLELQQGNKIDGKSALDRVKIPA